MRLFLLVLTAIGSVVWTAPLAAQNYPVRPVRVVIPFAAGGGFDIALRPVLQKMSENMQQQFILDMRPGANGIIGSEIVAKSAPDGYTLLGGGTGTLTINPNVYAKLPFDTVRDFAPITNCGNASFVMAVHPSVPVRDVKEFIALAKRKPGELTYGSPGVGGPNHLGGAYFAQLTGLQMVHVAYKGSLPMIMDLVGGHIQMVFDSIMQTVPRIRVGHLRAMGIAAPKRSPIAPEIPTIAEAGGPEMAIGSWYGLVAPAGTPRDIIAKLQAEAVKALADPAVRRHYAAIGIDPVGSTPEETAKLIRDDIARFGKVVRAAGIRAQ